MKTTTQNIGLYGIGTEFCIHLDNIGNDSDENIHDVMINVKVPDGVKFSRANLQQGKYNALTDTWEVGTLIKKTDIVGSICYTVEDDTKGPFTFTFDIGTGTSCKGCGDDRIFCVMVIGDSCTDVAKCAGAGFYLDEEYQTGRTDLDGKPIYAKTWSFPGTVTSPQPLTGLIPDDITRILKTEQSWKIAGPPAGYMFAPIGIVENAAGTNQPYEVMAPGPASQDFTDLIITIYYTK